MLRQVFAIFIQAFFPGLVKIMIFEGSFFKSFQQFKYELYQAQLTYQYQITIREILQIRFMNQNLSSDFKLRAIQKNNHQIQCPYLSTIRRHLIDFDFQKVCSISLSNNNVYGCLVCGRYYQGKGQKSPAYQHSIEYNHYLFINLENAKIFCLPDNYEVESHTLKDIKYNLAPSYKREDLQKLYGLQPQYNIDGKQYIPGIIGMNNLGETDYATCVFQLLNVVKQFRQYLLLNEFQNDALMKKISLFYKKVWNNNNFKGVISPHEVFQIICERSAKFFKIGKKGDPSTFLVWSLNNIDKTIRKSKEKTFDLLSLFQGTVKTSHIKGIKNSAQYEQFPTKIQQKKFTILKLQFPQKGIFNKTKNQTPLKQLMEKYTGSKGVSEDQGLTFMKIIDFPRYLNLVFKRFNKTEYKMQKDSSEVLYNGNLQIMGHKYRLVGQICHQGDYLSGHYKAYLSRKQRWFLVEDLQVRQILKKDMLLGQPFMQLYQKIQ